MRLKKRYTAILVAIVLCFAPVAAVLWSTSFAKRHGCTLHEGYTNPCVVNGVDHAERLYGAFVSGWFMLITLPLAALFFAILILLAIFDLIRHHRTKP